MFADIIVPLALSHTLTYRLTEAMSKEACIGARVVVEIGKRKQYTGLIIRLHNDAPAEGVTLKEVIELVDATPLVIDNQWALWQWVAHYYMCTLGEVMKAALPSGLKMESEMLVGRHEDFCNTTELSPIEQQVLIALEEPKTLDKLATAIGRKSVQTLVRQLLERGAVVVNESLNRKFRPRTETHLRLSEKYHTETALNALFDTLRRTPKQEALLTAYLDLSEASTAFKLQNMQLLKEVSKKALLTKTEGGETALTALRKKGVLEAYAFVVDRHNEMQKGSGITHALSASQANALAQIEAFFEERNALRTTPEGKRQPNVCLLHGITSSGKTEVYTELIQRALQRGEQVLYLVPEIALTTQLTARLGRVFGQQMGVYHSKFPDAERVELWQRQLSDRAFPLIVGVRSSLFLPFQRLGLIIVDEEHEQSYKQQDPAPRYHAREVAMVLASQVGAKVLLGTATPSVETYRAALSGRYGLVELTTRFGDVQLPKIMVEDIKELRRKRLMTTPFSPLLIEEITEALANKEQVILFQNRRGYSPQIACNTCGWVPRCTTCDVSLTYHQGIQSLVCHYCGKISPIPQQCPCCEGTELREQGYGTERIEEAVQQLFPTARTARMDLDTTRSRSAYERIIQSFERGETDILIGTQMVTKGLDFDRVRTVGILYADQMMNAPDFRAHERAYQMMSQVAGRAGRRGQQGRVVLQTQQADLPLVQQVCIGDYGGMYANAFHERKAFHYPPFSRLIYIYFKHRDSNVAESAAHAFAATLRPHFGEYLLGPDKPLVGRVQSLHIRKLMLKVLPTLSPTAVRRTLSVARDALLAQSRYRSVNVYFDVDPV